MCVAIVIVLQEVRYFLEFVLTHGHLTQFKPKLSHTKTLSLFLLPICQMDRKLSVSA